MTIRRVGDIEFDGSCVTVTIGRAIVEVMKISYADSITTSTVTSMGSQEQDARTDGSYKTEQVSITIRGSLWRRDVLPTLPPNGFGNSRRSIVVGYKHPELGTDSDELAAARFVNLGAAMEAGEKAAEIELKCDIKQIFWGDGRFTLNRVKGHTQISA